MPFFGFGKKKKANADSGKSYVTWAGSNASDAFVWINDEQEQ